jgi:hypothetical protein
MSLREHEHEEAIADAEDTTGGLFLGDTGELPLETRRALIQLLSGPCLDGRRHSKLWPVLARDEALLRARLSELFLDLVVDHEQRVAFTRQAEVGDLDAPVLLRRLPLTFIDSVILLYLRHRLTQADAHGERAAVDADEIAEHLVLYERAANTDHAGFTKKIQASIEKMKKNSILQRIGGGENRFEISPTLKLLFSAEEIQALTGQYQALLSGAASRLAVEPEGEEDAE